MLSFQTSLLPKPRVVPKGRTASAPAIARTVLPIAKHSEPCLSSARTDANDTKDTVRQALQVSRRDLALQAGVFGLASILSAPTPANADDEVVEFTTYYGAANPPATYGGIGGTTKDKARYSFSVPTSWKEEAVSKIEKGTNGTDARLVGGSARKKEKVYVVSLANEGGIGGFKLDKEQTLSSLSGSDATFQDALAGGEIEVDEVEVDGQPYLDYKIKGTDNFLIRVTTRQGRLFGLFVNANSKGLKDDADVLSNIINSFRTYDLN